jgi:hypothetical protein
MQSAKIPRRKGKGELYMTGKWVWDGTNSWRIGTEFLSLDVYEDCETHTPNECECTEIWLRDDKTGKYDTEGIFNTYEEAKSHAEQFMRENPNGWLLKDSLKTEYDKREKVTFT